MCVATSYELMVASCYVSSAKGGQRGATCILFVYSAFTEGEGQILKSDLGTDNHLM